MIQGKSCTLTVAKDGEYYPLPYSEETVRQASKGYALPGCIGIRNREKLVETGKAITGCVVTRLEYNNILALFLLLFYSNDKFDILVGRVFEKFIYKNVSVKEFETDEESVNSEDSELPEPTRIPADEKMNILEYDEFFLLVYGKAVFYIIPKENFEEKELEVIRNIKK